MDRLTQELGEGYEIRLIEFLEHLLELHKQNPFQYYEVPTFHIMRNLDWQGKSYWVNKLLNQMADEGKLVKHTSRAGNSWSLCD